MTSEHDGVHASGLGKQFGDLWALRDVDLDVQPGTVLGLLGHNGAGKTTAIRILTTLSRPTEGSATVAGIDVAERPEAVRPLIGLAGQGHEEVVRMQHVGTMLQCASTMEGERGPLVIHIPDHHRKHSERRDQTGQPWTWVA